MSQSFSSLTGGALPPPVKWDFTVHPRGSLTKKKEALRCKR